MRKKIELKRLFLIYAIIFLGMAKITFAGVKHAEWSKNAAIYEVNIRQYTPEGTFDAFSEKLPELKSMGVKILWLMPIHPIGEKRRKGKLGSYYSVKNYKAVNPEFGTEQDFQDLVNKIHAMGMYIILDWVANHTAWDHKWIKENPEFYTHDSTGKIITPVKSWSDVADLNYDNKELRNEMLSAMTYWVSDFNIDGFRCDVASLVPTDFWNTVRDSLEQIKPVFMLAESDDPELHHNAFDMTYAWKYMHVLHEIAAGKADVDTILNIYASEQKNYAKNDYRMIFLTNHDENSWNGTVRERYGKYSEAFTVWQCLFPGMPLIYSGQEAGLNERLAFFKKDTIQWREHKNRGIFTKLLQLKKSNKALWNGEFGGETVFPKGFQEQGIHGFIRKNEDEQVLAIFNFSDLEKRLKLNSDFIEGSYYDIFQDRSANLTRDDNIILKPFDYKVFVK